MALSDQVVNAMQSGKRTRGEAYEFDHRDRNVRPKRDPERPVKIINVVRKKCEIFHKDYRGDGALIVKGCDNWWYGYMTIEVENVFRKWLDMKKLGTCPNDEHEVKVVDYDEKIIARVQEFGNYKMN